MKKCYALLLSLGLCFMVSGCPKKPGQVVRTVFPACFAEPKIGASSGVRCEYDQEQKQWRIVFWRGWGDCPAGCIHKEDYAYYLVDEKGRVFEADENFRPVKELPPDRPINPTPERTEK